MSDAPHRETHPLPRPDGGAGVDAAGKFGAATKPGAVARSDAAGVPEPARTQRRVAEGEDAVDGRPLWVQIREDELADGGWVSLGACVGLALVVFIFAQAGITNDRFTPFRSIGFVLGAGMVFFMGTTYSTRHALYAAAGVLALMASVQFAYLGTNVVGLGELTGGLVAVQLVFTGIFLVGLAIVPNLVPTMCEMEAAALTRQNVDSEARLAQLRSELDLLEKAETKEKAAVDRQEQVKVSSRITSLHTYAREMLQASSPKEVQSLVFHNLSKVAGAEECLLLVVAREAAECIVARALHPDYEKLENSRLSFDNSIVKDALARKRAVQYRPPAELMEKVKAQFVLPIIAQGEVEALFVIGRFKGGDPTAEDLDFIDTLGKIAQGALEQLRIATSTA